MQSVRGVALMAGGAFTAMGLDVGDAGVKALFKRLGPLAGQEGAKALLPELQAILAGARQNIRNRTGKLSASGRVLVPRVYPDAVSGKVTFGDRGISYAIAAHQMPGRPSHKYLDRAAKARAAGMGQRIAERLGKGIERGAA